MAKKLTKKTAAKSKKATKSTKKIKKENAESNSFGVMILAILGLVLLLYFGTSNVSVDVQIDEKSVEIQPTNTTIVISKKTYDSKENAFQELRFLPQSRLTDAERSFVESYIED
tara:strand:- start:401 stop:742 length:342 start_codon:yes stop_codon:yes gene_type:complete